jgi:hypothetical protein
MKTFLAGLGIILLILFFTNPDRQDFKEYMQKEIRKKMELKESPGMEKMFSSLVSGALSQVYTRDNYYFFSVYSLGEYKILGIAGFFLPLNDFDESMRKELDKIMKEFR